MFVMEEQFVLDIINKEGGIESIDESIELLFDYLEADYYNSKNKRLNQIMIDITKKDLHEIVIAVFTQTLLNKVITYQAICGKLNHKIKMKDTIDRVKTIAEMIAIINKTDLIDIHRQGAGNKTYITTDYEIEEEIPTKDKHALILHRPQIMESNRDDEIGSLLLGNSMNFHNEEICLDHLNRMNQIPLTLNKAFISIYKEATETELDTQQKQDQWDQFVKDSYDKYIEFMSKGNKGYLMHKYDVRGRSYADGYHINPQGASFKKAIVQLYNKEIVKG